MYSVGIFQAFFVILATIFESFGLKLSTFLNLSLTEVHLLSLLSSKTVQFNYCQPIEKSYVAYDRFMVLIESLNHAKSCSVFCLNLPISLSENKSLFYCKF